jgi:hypothetical protein
LQFTTQKITFIIKTVIMMTIKYGLQFFFFELTDNDGQIFLAGIVYAVHDYFKHAVGRDIFLLDCRQVLAYCRQNFMYSD